MNYKILYVLRFTFYAIRIRQQEFTYHFGGTMIEVNALRKGTTFTHDGELFKVLEFTHNKTGRGGATIRTKVVNLRTGSIYEKTFTGGERVEDISLDHAEAQYLYNDGDIYYFMDTETYEQPAFNHETIEDLIPYLTEGMKVK